MERAQRELAELLLANKADPNERNNADQTPLDLAKSQARAAQAQPPKSSGSFSDRLQATTGKEQASKAEAMADLLRQHGAADDLPRLDRIEVRRPATKYSSTVFTKGTNDWSQFTLLDLIGVQYGFLAASPSDRGGASYYLSAFINAASCSRFPDLAHVRIRQPSPDQKGWHEQVADLTQTLDAGDCSKGVHLAWGDVVEIPEADHPLNEQWKGFSRSQLANLKKCLARQVEVVIKGQATNMTLAPKIYNLEGGAQGHGPEPYIDAQVPFWLRPALLNSGLVLASSDLSHVKVTRRDPGTGQTHEWVVDCSDAAPAPDLWLQNGDKIEVPEKTN